MSPRRFGLVALLLSLALAAGVRANPQPPPLPPGPPVPGDTGTWSWISPKLGAADLYDVTFPTTGHGYAVGAGGTVIRTNDGGTTWEARPTPAGTGDLKAVSASGQLVVACGANGTLVRSTDGASSFTTVPWMLNRMPPDWVDVQVLDATSGVLIGSDGTFAITGDSFQSVQPIGQVTALTPKALWFSNPQKGWIVGGSNGGGTVVETTDGGHSFNVVHTGQGGAYRAVAGISFGTTNLVIVGGATLPRATVLDESQPQQGWKDLELPGGPIDSISIALGAANEPPELWFAADDGLWDIRVGDQQPQRPLIQTTPALHAVAAATRGEAFAVGDGGSIYEALYGGGLATIINGGDAESFTSSTFPTSDGQEGAFASNDVATGASKLVGTTDGAQTLFDVQTAPDNIVDITAVDALHGFGLLQNGDFYASNDGGLTWTRESTLTNRPAAIAFSSTSVGYAAGNGILQTSNGGATWTTAVPAGQSFNDVAVGPNGIAAAVGGSTISVYMGGSWQSMGIIAPGTQSCLFVSVSIESDGTLVAGGADGNGAGCVWEVPLQAATPIGPTEYRLASKVLSVAAVGTRVFLLFVDGHVSELVFGTEVSVFQSHSKLNRLVARTVLDSAGATHPAPIAYGDYGALLVFNDGAAPPPPPPPAPIVKVTPDSISLPFGQTASVTAVGIDAQGLPLTYAWSDPNNAGLKFSATNSATTTISWAAQPPSGTVAIARVTVCDSAGACSTADVKVDSGPGTTGNQPPVAVAKGISVTTGTPILLDGSSSTDPDGDALTYKWQQLSGPPATIEGGLAGPVLVADGVSTPGDLVFALTVCDTANLCARIEVTVVVYAPNTNSPPVAMTKGDLVVPPNGLALLDASDSYDPEDGSNVTFSWREVSGPRVLLSTPTDAVASFQAGAAGTTYRFVVRVCDQENACSEAATNVTVSSGTPTNLPPVVKAREPAMTASVGDRVTLSAIATEPEGEPVTVTWTDDQPNLGLGLTPSGPDDATFTVPPAAAGKTLKFTVSACDSAGACATADATVTVAMPSVVANAGPDQLVGAGQPVTLDGSASTGTIVTWKWNQSAGPTVSLSATDQPKATFTAPGAQATLRFTLTVTGNDGRSATDEVVVTVTGPQPPVADAGPDQTVGWGARVQLDGSASHDPQGRALTYQWKGPDGITLTGADTTLAFFYAPSINVRLGFTLTVCAGTACADSACDVQVVKAANLPPLPDAGPDVRAMGGSTIVLDGTGSIDPERERLTASWSQSSGDAATIGAADALWTQVKLPNVTREETLVFALKVCDPEGLCGVDTVSVDVLPSAGAPTIAASIAGHPDGEVDEAASFTVTLTTTCPSAPCADGGQLKLVTGPPIARVGTTGWTFAAPTVTKDLPFSFEASVCDTQGRCGVSRLDGMVVNSVNDPPVAVVGPDQKAARRQTVTLDASDSFDPNSDALAFTWSQSAGPTMTLAPDGASRVRFTVPAAEAPGELDFSVKVCDPHGACASASTKVTVTAGPPFDRAPLADAGGDKVGPAGVPIVLDASRSFDPDGDPLTYSWSITNGPGATLDSPDAAVTKLVVPGITQAGSPVVVALKVCDDQNACDTAEVNVTTYALPRDTTSGDAKVGAPVQGCGCASDPGSMAALAFGLVTLAFRRRRSAR